MYKNGPRRARVVIRYLFVTKGINFSFSKYFEKHNNTLTTQNCVPMRKIRKYFCTKEKCERDDYVQ